MEAGFAPGCQGAGGAVSTSSRAQERRELLIFDLHLPVNAEEYEISERLKQEETAMMRFRRSGHNGTARKYTS